MFLSYLLLIPFMSFVARVAGGGYFASKIWSRLPEVVFASVFGIAAGVNTGNALLGMLAFIVTYFAFEMGHGTFYTMRGYHDHNSETGKPRIQTLEKVVRPVYQALGGDIYHPLYSWVCMGFKGLLVGIAALPFGIFLAILFPLSYWVGHRVFKKPEIAEYLSGACAGLIIALSL